MWDCLLHCCVCVCVGGGRKRKDVWQVFLDGEKHMCVWLKQATITWFVSKAAS